MDRSRHSGSREIGIGIFLMIAALLAAAAGCGGTSDPGGGAPAPRQSGADITGVVWQVSDGVDGTGSLLVIGLAGVPSTYDRASVRLGKDTVWRQKDGSQMDTPPLDRELVGRRVAVTFTGAVAESYPVQVAASEVTLIDPLGVSQNVTLVGAPQLHGTALALDRDDAGNVTGLTVLPQAGPAAQADAAGQTQTGDVAQVHLKITSRTLWVLDTPTEAKSSQAPLIGNGLEPQVEVRAKGLRAEWVMVHLPESGQ